MNHAEKISANSKIANKKNTGTPAPAIGRFREMDEETKRCRGNSKGQQSICSSKDVANAFLKMCFPARLEEKQDFDKLKIEGEFYSSLSLIIKKFKLSIQDCSNLPYPYNISASMTVLRKVLKEQIMDWPSVRLIQHEGSVFFAEKDRYDTGMTLFYIPILPLYAVLQRKETLKAGMLLLSVYSYIYKILDVPYYRNENCFLNYTYDTLEEWIIEDGTDPDSLSEIKEAKEIGDFIKEKISEPKNLRCFKNRLQKFRPKNVFEKHCQEIAERFYDIYKKYPKIPIYRKFNPVHFDEEVHDSGRHVLMDDYISFCASVEGNLAESLFQFVNDDLQDFSEIDEPIRYLPYDSRKIDDNDFDFEKEVFESMENLMLLWQKFNF